MKRTAKLASTTLLVLLAACVTRSKHQSTITSWEEKQAQLQKEYSTHKAQSAADLDKQKQKLAALEEKNRAELDLFASKLESSRGEIESLRKHRAKIEKSLEQFRKLEEAFKNMIGAGEIRVYRRRGRIMVALPSSVLFRSGRAKLSSAGKKAIARVGAILAKLPDRRFLVAGHTDNVPIRNADFEDNWELSAARALVVTRFMIANSVKPTMLASAGYGEHDPLKSNRTKNGRRANRRIEIILMPNIDELPELPDTE